tara:strand:- start:100 stop:201 length:102 start_codon:yes stop_codon:yes gene_type:complete
MKYKEIIKTAQSYMLYLVSAVIFYNEVLKSTDQ